MLKPKTNYDIFDYFSRFGFILKDYKVFITKNMLNNIKNSVFDNDGTTLYKAPKSPKEKHLGFYEYSYDQKFEGKMINKKIIIKDRGNLGNKDRRYQIIFVSDANKQYEYKKAFFDQRSICIDTNLNKEKSIEMAEKL